MALLDKLKNALSRKKETPAAPLKEWPAPENGDFLSEPAANPPAEPKPELTAEQVIRIAASRQPAQEFTLPAMRTLLDYAVKAIPTLDTVRLTGPGQRLTTDNSIPSGEILQLIGGVYAAIEGMLKVTRLEKAKELWRGMDRDTLLNGLKALAHFANGSEKMVFSKTYCGALAEYLRPQLTQADFAAAEIQETINKIDALQLKYTLTAKQDKASPQLADITKEICMHLRMIDALYVAYDTDFNPLWPFMGADGRPEVFTTEALAEAARSHFAQIHEGRFTVKKIASADLPGFWQSLSRLGIGLFRLNNGRNPVELKVQDVQLHKSGAVIDDANAGMRNMLLRNLQYAYRLRKLDPSQKGTPREQALFHVMATMQANGFRELGLGLTYVLGPKSSGGLCYTPKALAQAKKILEMRGLDENHLAPAGVSWEVFEGPTRLRVVNKPGQPGMEHAQLCVFTEYAQAAMVRDRFAQSGHDDGVLVISFEEMFAQANQCAGIVMDMPTLGLEIPKNDFPKILQFRAAPGPIVIKLTPPENKTES